MKNIINLFLLISLPTFAQEVPSNTEKAAYGLAECLDIQMATLKEYEKIISEKRDEAFDKSKYAFKRHEDRNELRQKISEYFNQKIETNNIDIYNPEKMVTAYGKSIAYKERGLHLSEINNRISKVREIIIKNTGESLLKVLEYSYSSNVESKASLTNELMNLHGYIEEIDIKVDRVRKSSDNYGFKTSTTKCLQRFNVLKSELIKVNNINYPLDKVNDTSKKIVPNNDGSTLKIQNKEAIKVK